MFGNNRVCSICDSETGFKGCICSGTIKLIGSNCLYNHLSESEVKHNVVDLYLAALRMQADPSTIQDLRIKLQEKDSIIQELSNTSALTRHTRGVRSVCMSDDGRWIVSGSLDKTVRI